MTTNLYSLISDDARCPTIARGTRASLYGIRRRAIAASIRTVYMGGCSGSIDPQDLRVLRADRAAPILAARDATARALAAAHSAMERAEQLALCMTGTTDQSVAREQADGLTDPSARRIVEAVRLHAASAGRVDSRYYGHEANLALAAYHPAYPYRWGHICQWSDTAYARKIAGR